MTEPRRPPDVGFEVAPAPGHRLTLDGRLVYELVSVTPHTRLDSKASMVLHWEGGCATCGAAFRVTTGLRSKSINRRCWLHRAPFQPATPAAFLRRTFARHNWNQRRSLQERPR